MIGLRRALLLTSGERYATLAISFVTIAVISRLLTPEEIGLSVIGMSAVAIAEALRDFGTTTYLVQRKDLTLNESRTAFTVLLVSSALIAAVVFCFAGVFARLYDRPGLAPYLQIIAASFLFGPLAAPIMAVMRRDMAFGGLAAINVTGSVICSAVTMSLAALGFSYMSFAWGALAWGASIAAFAICLRPELGIFRLRVGEWRSVLTFGGYSSATILLNKAYEVLPYLVIARILSIDAVGLFSRAVMVCQLPDKFVFTAITPVALSALASEVREGRDIKKHYLTALEHITVLQWPALVLLAILAHPTVYILLGQQWLSIVPLVQILAIASLSLFPAVLTYPTLVATGRIKDTLTASLISLPISAALLVLASRFGLQAMALVALVAMPLQAYVAVSFIRRQVAFEWSELAVAVRKSALVTACAAAGPAAIVASMGFHFDTSLALAGVAAVLFAMGWAAGLWLTQHPFMHELQRAAGALRIRAGLGISKRQRPIETRLG